MSVLYARLRPAGDLVRSNGAYRRYALARLSSTLGTTVAPLGLAFAVLQAGGGATALGLVLTSSMLIFIAVTPGAGVLADRLPRVAIIIGCQLGCGATQLIAAILVLTGTAQVWSLTALAAITGAASACFLPAAKGIVPQLVDALDLVTANALLQIASNAIAIVGPALAGLLIALSDPGWILAWDAATFLASAAIFTTVRLPAPSGRTQRRRWAADFAEGWHVFTSRRWLWVLTLLGMITSACWAAGIVVLGPLYATQYLNGAVSWGLISSAIGIGLACGSLASLLWPPTRIGLVACWAALPEATLLASMSLNTPLPVIAAASALTGAAGTFQLINWTAYQQQVIPEAQLGRVLATTATIGTLLIPFFYLAAGPIAEAVGTRAVLGACALLIGVSMCLTWCVPTVRTLALRAPPNSPDPPSEEPPSRTVKGC